MLKKVPDFINDLISQFISKSKILGKSIQIIPFLNMYLGTSPIAKIKIKSKQQAIVSSFLRRATAL